MAYNDYGAFVYKNGERRPDKEDVAVFASDEETFGFDSKDVPSGGRIFTFLLNKHPDYDYDWVEHPHHGVMGDGDIRVACYKQGLPDIYEATSDGIKKIDYRREGMDLWDYDIVTFDYKGYRFEFSYCGAAPYVACMTEPDGTEWICKYDYAYGAGFEE